MADRFIIQGATYDGDGTTSAEAASNGAAGAWKTLAYLEGTAPVYGTLPAGATVYIRSKTAAGADITRTLAGSTTFGVAGTAAAMTKVVLDGGTKWAGINGTLTYECPSTYDLTFANYLEVRCETTHRFVIKETNTSSNYKTIIRLPTVCNLEGIKVDCSLNGHVAGNYIYAPGSHITTMKDVMLIWRRHATTMFYVGESARLTLINPSIELQVVEPGEGVFHLPNYGGFIKILGGRIFGAGATTGTFLTKLKNMGGILSIVGTTIPKTVAFSGGSLPAEPQSYRIEAFGLDGGSGAVAEEAWGIVDSRSDGFYPTLDSYLPTSTGQPWSWKLYPHNAGAYSQISVPVLKLYTDTAAAKTITAHVLIADTISTATKESLWLDISYTDHTTGLPVGISTRDYSAAALATDTAAWSASTWGSINLLKRKLEITTPSSIKKDTPVMVTLRGTVKSASDQDLIFFCPDVGIA